MLVNYNALAFPKRDGIMEYGKTSEETFSITPPNWRAFL